MKASGFGFAMASMLSFQISAALSTHVFDALTPAGSAWIRLAISAVFALVVARPRVGDLNREARRTVLLLGCVTAVAALAFIEAVARIPLGTTSAIEFLGPLSVAVARGRRRWALVWPTMALVGVLGLTDPWHGRLDPAGIGFAALSGVTWATYIVLTQRIGAQVEGFDGLAVSLCVAAVVAAPVAAAPALRGMTAHLVWPVVGLSLLGPLLPFACELLALRRMRVAAFGTLMAIEPATGTVTGLVVLSQLPTVWQVLGVALVVVAGVGAQWHPVAETAPEAVVGPAAPLAADGVAP